MMKALAKRPTKKELRAIQTELAQFIHNLPGYRAGTYRHRSRIADYLRQHAVEIDRSALAECEALIVAQEAGTTRLPP